MPNVLTQAARSVLPATAYSGIRGVWHRCLRISKEGPLNAYKRGRLWRRILSTPPVHTSSHNPDISVHLMCHEGDHLCAIWALKSFYHYAGQRFPLVIHVQGKTSGRLRRRLRTHFPDARIILQEEADRIVEAFLRERNLERLLQKRRSLSIMQKFTDVLIAANARKIVLFDADVLFFRRPDELLDAAAAPERTALFQRDFTDAYVTTPTRASFDFHIDLSPRINTGIVTFSTDIVDWQRCENYLAHPDFSLPNGHTEQTLYALEASRNHAVSYLPPSYLVALEDRAEYATLAARHYSSPSRALFTRAGIPHLLQRGFLRELQMSSPDVVPSAVPAKLNEN